MNVTLIPWATEAADALLTHANNPKVAAHMADGFPQPWTPEIAAQYIARANADKPTRIFAIAVDGDVVGSIGIFPETDIHRKNAAIAYWLAEAYWGQGIMAEAIRQIVRYGFAAFDIARIYAKPFGINHGSQRALEKAGFHLEARIPESVFKHGEFMDELIYAVRRPGHPSFVCSA